MAATASEFVEVGDLRLHYLSAGEGDPVVLLHGWPTSSFLWRNVMPSIAVHNRAIALDLPGFGQSDKPLDASYSFRFFDRVLDGFFEALGIGEVSLAVHDLGGPVGLYWACHHWDRVRRLALLNTLVYPEASWAVAAFVMAVRTPGLRNLLTSPWGLKTALRLGVARPDGLAADAVPGIQAPFRTSAERRALAKAGCNLSPKGFREIADLLAAFEGPVQIVYGEKDRILPDIAKTMARVKRDLPQAELTSLPDCGHFLQEDRPDEVGRLLSEFFSGAVRSS